MKRIKLILTAALIFICGCFSSCGDRKAREEVFFAMDTVITLRGDGLTDGLVSGAEALTERYEALFSATSGELGLLNGSEDAALELPAETAELVGIALGAAEATEGAFDPTLGALVELWNIPKSAVVPDASAIAEALSRCGLGKVLLDGTRLTRERGVRLTLGGVAKGYACEKVIKYLRAGGSERGLVSFGGNVGVYGKKTDGGKWRIAVRSPRDENAVAGYIDIDSGFVAVSGDYERFFIKDGVRYHHIFDGSTGYPADSGVYSAAVWCEDGALGDALSTALFVMGAEGSLEFYRKDIYDFEALLICADGIYMTDGMKNMYTPSDKS